MYVSLIFHFTIAHHLIKCRNKVSRRIQFRILITNVIYSLTAGCSLQLANYSGFFTLPLVVIEILQLLINVCIIVRRTCISWKCETLQIFFNIQPVLDLRDKSLAHVHPSIFVFRPLYKRRKVVYGLLTSTYVYNRRFVLSASVKVTVDVEIFYF